MSTNCSSLLAGGRGRDIQSKVKACSEVLAGWGKEITGNFNKVIKESKRRLKVLRAQKDDHSL